eukprot:1377700-Heterocapsa_arctica.AAC.1
MAGSTYGSLRWGSVTVLCPSALVADLVRCAVSAFPFPELRCLPVASQDLVDVLVAMWRGKRVPQHEDDGAMLLVYCFEVSPDAPSEE